MYSERIRDVCPNHDPRHIEAYMRLQFGTLDHLSAEQFNAEARAGAQCVDVDGTENAERLARSFGL